MKKNRKNPIADFVRERRKYLKMTQVDLSNRAGVGLRFVRELEQGKPTLRVDKVNEVLKLFGRELGPVILKFEFDDEDDL
ncbi:MAG: helix-turn-helix transcriptional regulator [Chitinophagales bacterium]